MLSALLVTGCATTEYIEVKPDCEVPPAPILPILTWDELLMPMEYLPNGKIEEWDNTLDKWEEYEAALGDSLAEHRAIVTAVCG